MIITYCEKIEAPICYQPYVKDSITGEIYKTRFRSKEYREFKQYTKTWKDSLDIKYNDSNLCKNVDTTGFYKECFNTKAKLSHEIYLPGKSN